MLKIPEGDNRAKATELDRRRALGQFFTPFEVAGFMAEWLLRHPSDKIEVLDPAAGLGVFPEALSSLGAGKRIDYRLWEVDGDTASELESKCDRMGINAQLHCGDFLLSDWSPQYDGIIANPPYIKHHFLGNKHLVARRASEWTGCRLSVQSNIYCWFLVKSLCQLAEGGRLAFIIPSEFLNANYGEGVKSYLLECGMVAHIIGVDFSRGVFADALTTSAIILAERGKSKRGHINFFKVDEPGELRSLESFLAKRVNRKINVNSLDPAIKWRNYFAGTLASSRNLVPLSSFGRFGRGIATGANHYFTLSRLEAKRRRIPPECLLPCITKSIHANGLVFGPERFEELAAAGKRVYLFDGQRSASRGAREYLELGESQGIDKRYLTRSRKPWYALEKREVSRIWVSVFGRQGLKFVWNGAQCLNLTCFHAFWANESAEDFSDILFIYLCTGAAKALFDRERREYGGGLSKFEPNDLNKSPVVDFRLLDKEQLANLRGLQAELLANSGRDNRKAIDPILRQAERIFNPLARSA